jgi:hypothetical protein
LRGRGQDKALSQPESEEGLQSTIAAPLFDLTLTVPGAGHSVLWSMIWAA